MNDNLGRDKIWTPEVWGEIDKAVKEEWKQRVAQTVIKTVPMDGAQDVASERMHQRAKASRLARPPPTLFGHYVPSRCKSTQHVQYVE